MVSEGGGGRGCVVSVGGGGGGLVGVYKVHRLPVIH